MTSLAQVMWAPSLMCCVSDGRLVLIFQSLLIDRGGKMLGGLYGEIIA